MLPDLIFIVAAYVIVRLLSLITRQFPALERHLATRVIMSVLAVAGIGLTVVAALDTLGTGMDGYHPPDPTHGFDSRIPQR